MPEVAVEFCETNAVRGAEMAKDYPRASLKKALEVAEAAYDLGGTCTIDVCADKLGSSAKGGSFRALIAGAAKYGLISTGKGEVTATSLYKEIKYAYSEAEKEKYLQTALLHVPLFAEIFERFKGKKVPIEILDKILIKECDVNNQIADTVGRYFIDGARSAGLLTADMVLKKDLEATEVDAGDDVVTDSKQGQATSVNEVPTDDLVVPPNVDLNNYRVNVSGPGINTTITIMELEDLEIVEVVLKKVRKKLEGVA